MAKEIRSVTFRNAVIDMASRTITEYEKDYTLIYKLDDVLGEWNGIGGISFSIKMQDDVEPAMREGDNEA